MNSGKDNKYGLPITVILVSLVILGESKTGKPIKLVLIIVRLPIIVKSVKEVLVTGVSLIRSMSLI